MVDLDWQAPREYFRLQRRAEDCGLQLRRATEPWHLEANGGHRFSVVRAGGRDPLLVTSKLAEVRRWLREYAETRDGGHHG